MPRRLRSRRQRLMLEFATDGHCAYCGEPLPTDWHADHVEPWKVTQRTNFTEMVAACPTCNKKKGARQ